MASQSQIYLLSSATTMCCFLQPRSHNYKDLQPFGDVQNFATMPNWWLQLQQVTPRGYIWDTRSSEANLGLACQTDPWSEWVDCHFKWTKPYRKIHGSTISVESQLSKLTTHKRARSCSWVNCRRKWTKSYRAALQNLWLDHNCPSKYTRSQEHGAQVSLWANLNACVPCSSTLPTCLTLPCESLLCPKCTASRHVQCAMYISCQLKV